MNKWREMIIKRRAKELIDEAQTGNMDFTSFMKQAARTGVSGDVDVQNFAAILQQEQRRSQQTGKQTAITSAVARSLESQPAMSEEQLRAEGGASLPPEQYAEQLAGNQEKYFGSPAPKTREELYGALGRQQLPEDTTFEDVKDNAQFQFAQGQFPGAEDELARARLKVQQDAEARKAKQIGEQQRLGDIRLRLQERDLDLKRYTLGVRSMERGLDDAATADKSLQQTIQDENDLTAEQKKLTEVIRSKSDEDGVLLNQDEIDAANARLAELSVLLVKSKEQKKAYEQKVRDLTKEAYTRGAGASKQSPKVFEQPAGAAPAAPAPAPATGGNLSETIAKKYNIQ